MCNTLQFKKVTSNVLLMCQSYCVGCSGSNDTVMYCIVLSYFCPAAWAAMISQLVVFLFFFKNTVSERTIVLVELITNLSVFNQILT